MAKELQQQQRIKHPHLQLLWTELSKDPAKLIVIYGVIALPRRLPTGLALQIMQFNVRHKKNKTKLQSCQISAMASDNASSIFSKINLKILQHLLRLGVQVKNKLIYTYALLCFNKRYFYCNFLS